MSINGKSDRMKKRRKKKEIKKEKVIGINTPNTIISLLNKVDD